MTKLRRLENVVRFSVLSLGAAVPSASAQDAGVSNEALLRRIEELEQQVKLLSRKGEIAEESAAEKAKSAATVSAGASGFQIRSADTNFVLKVRGYMQADSRWYIDDQTPVNDTFLMRRVRPIIEGTVFEKYDYRLMLDFGSGVTGSAANNGYVQDAYLNARFLPEFQVQVGKFKEPVGLERNHSASTMPFIERAYPSQLLPNRDVGVQLHGDLLNNSLSYALGLFNGVADGGSGDIERTDDEKDVAARLFAHLFKNTKLDALRGLGIGIAGTFGNQAGTPRSYTSPGQQTIFSYHTGTNPVTQDGTVWRISPQAYYYWKSLGVLAEYAISSHHVTRTVGGLTSSSKLEQTAWQVALSYFLTGEENSFRGVSPKKPFNLGGGGWGAWEVAARISGLSLDKEVFPTFANPNTSASDAISYTLGLNWHLNRNFKAGVNYEHTDFDGGNANPAIANGENAILTRAQISF